MINQWRLLCDLLWPEPLSTSLPHVQPGIYKNTHFVLPYKNLEVKNTIRNNKFHHHTESAKTLAEAIDVVFAKYSNLTIIPIPSSNARMRTRGFEHLLRILDFSECKNCVQTNVLRKKVNTKSQSHVDKKTRGHQQKNAFRCNTKATQQLTGTVILFDDVVTTEATMAAARASLAPHLRSNAKLICLAVAH